MCDIEMERYRITDTAEWLCDRAYAIVTAQFPDELLPQAATIVTSLRNACSARGHTVQIYILADTTYNSLSVDEVAAAHINAHCVIHYGRASLTKVSRLPAFFVFPQADLDIPAATAALVACEIVTAATMSNPAIVFLDQPHLHVLDEFKAGLQAAAPEAAFVFANVPTRHLDPVESNTTNGCTNSSTTKMDGSGSGCGCSEQTTPPEQEQQTSCGESPGVHSAAGYSWQLDPAIELNSCSFVWVGDVDAPALKQLQLTHSASSWVCFDSKSGSSAVEGLSPEVTKVLRRRYYLVEKAKDAAIIGIVVGTLGAAGYRQVLDRLQHAARAAGKKTYTLLMGKPNPAKLANFPEIEIFVLVADPQGQILDSKDYLAPIITPHEAMIAFTPGLQWDSSRYSLDLDDNALAALAGSGDLSSEEPRFSLLSGSYHQHPDSVHLPAAGTHYPDDEPTDHHQLDAGTALALHAQQSLTVSKISEEQAVALQPRSAAEYFVNKRSWTGVEAPVVGAEPRAVEKAAMGRSGRAAVYTDEPSSHPDTEG